jgi:outer membrane protein assembly factor BamB
VLRRRIVTNRPTRDPAPRTPRGYCRTDGNARLGGRTCDVANFDGTLVALDAATGTERWRRDAGGRSSPAVVGDTVYLSGRDFVYALDAATGEQHWANSMAAGPQGPVVVGGSVFVADSSGVLYRLGRRSMIASAGGGSGDEA